MLKILEFFLGFSLTKIVSIAVAVMFYTFILAYSVFVFNLIYRVYNIVTHLSDYFNSGSGKSDILCKVYGLLSCSGILDGLQASQSFIVPAITALLTAYGFRISFGVKKQLTDAILKITS